MRINLQLTDTFALWAEAWLESRQLRSLTGPQAPRHRYRYVADRTLKSYAQYVRALTGSLGQIPLNEISLEHLRQYQAKRSLYAGPNKINSQERWRVIYCYALVVLNTTHRVTRCAACI